MDKTKQEILDKLYATGWELILEGGCSYLTFGNKIVQYDGQDVRMFIKPDSSNDNILLNYLSPAYIPIRELKLMVEFFIGN